MERERVMQLLTQYGDDVFRLAMSYLGNRADAEDISQTVFLRVLRTKCEPLPEKEKSWLLTCTANACKNHLQSFWKRNVGALDEAIPFYQEQDQALYDAVMKLAPKYRAVIHLYYYEGYTQGEIGEILHLSRTAVQTRMSRAREMLKKELNDNEGALSEYDGTGETF